MSEELAWLEGMLKDNKIVIYGAGKWASVFYTYLQIIGLDANVLCFTVTQKSNSDKSQSGKDIKQYDEIKDQISECLVIVAIKNAEKLVSSISSGHKGDLISLTESHMQNIYEHIFFAYENNPIQRNKILVDNNEGRCGYCCNSKYIVEKLFEKKYPVEVVWEVNDKNMWQFPKGIKVVEINTLEYFRELYTAGIVINNHYPLSIPFKRKEQYVINPWHGTGPFKRVGIDLVKDDPEKVAQIKQHYSANDVFLSNSKDNTEMFRNSLDYKGEIYECGSPRCDILFQENNLKEKIYAEYGIDPKKKLLLYVPTFRGSFSSGGNSSWDWYDIDMKQVLDALSQRFGKEFVLMYRFHYLLYAHNRLQGFYPDGIDVTFYPDVMELIVAADVMITDYSSAMWDFSLQRRPVFLYHNDEKEYTNDRGFYWPVSKWPYPRAHTCEELCETIREFKEEEYLEKLEQFFMDDPSYDDGYASERVAERIMDVIEHPEKYGKEN